MQKQAESRHKLSTMQELSANLRDAIADHDHDDSNLASQIAAENERLEVIKHRNLFPH
jgi:hypothetical protein